MHVDVEKIINDFPKSYDEYRKFLDSRLNAKVAYKVAYRVYIRCRLAEAQNWKCCFCGCEMTEYPNYKNSVTLEHVEPYSKSKNDHISNLVVSCHKCNTNRGVMCAYEFSINPCNTEKQQMNKKEKQQKKKFEKYLKKVDKFKNEGFPVNERVSSFEEWVDTLPIREYYREMLREHI